MLQREHVLTLFGWVILSIVGNLISKIVVHHRYWHSIFQKENGRLLYRWKLLGTKVRFRLRWSSAHRSRGLGEWSNMIDCEMGLTGRGLHYGQDFSSGKLQAWMTYWHGCQHGNTFFARGVPWRWSFLGDLKPLASWELQLEAFLYCFASVSAILTVALNSLVLGWNSSAMGALPSP